MTRITQISASAILVIFASSAFISTANAHGPKVWCQQSSSKVFRTACEKSSRKYTAQRSVQPPRYPPTVIQNFGGSRFTDKSLNGSEAGAGGSDGAGGGGAGGGGAGGGGANGNGGSAGRP